MRTVGAAVRDALQTHAPELWRAASAEADDIVAALARTRIAYVARKHAPTREDTRVKTTTWAETHVELPRSGKRRRAAPTGASPSASAADVEKKRLEEALELAFALADEIGMASGRLRQITESILREAEHRSLLTVLFQQKAKVPATPMGHIRAVCRLRSWSASKGLDPWQLTPLEIAYFLRDTSVGRNSVPRMLLSGLDWLHTALVLPWALQDAAVQAVAKMTSRDASLARLQATPYTYQTVADLLGLLGARDDVADSTAYAILFLLCLAFACLRFSDLDRSAGVSLGRDALHATCWRSKGKPAPVPWAALRVTWTGVDWGKQFFDLIHKVLPQGADAPRDWLWPAMVLVNGALEFVTRCATAAMPIA